MDKKLTDLSSAGSLNIQLRTKIDQLRREKILYKGIRDKLKQDMEDKEAEIIRRNA